MATIRKLPSGKWNVQIRRHGHQPVTQSFTLEKDARRWARTIESEQDRGVFIDRSEAEATTLGEALGRYLLEVTPHKKGRAQEIQRINAWLKRPLSVRSLASLKPKDFSVYRDTRSAEGVATNTARLELALISHLFNTARKEWGIAVLNPIESIRMPKGSKARCRRLQGDEAERLITACKASKSHQLYSLVTIALETGMRLGELLKLTWEDVDLQKRLALIREAKNGEGRGIPLSSRAVEVLHVMPRSIDCNRVFYSWEVRSDAIKKAWGNAIKKSGLQDFHFHDLRHEATSRLFEKDLNPMEVATITGHKTLRC